MAVSGDVTIAQDGGQGNVKVHPYLVALVRWCVSCLWSSATVLLHRLMTAPLPQITGTASKPSKPRPAGRDHLHPEPKVECVVLHQPPAHTMDVVFVHGLYGSLCNTWRQGEWKSKYHIEPEKVHLRRPNSIPNSCTCSIIEGNKNTNKDVYCSLKNERRLNSDYNFTNIDDNFYGDFITEKFYNNTLLDQVEIVDNYETQAQFVSDLFKRNCDSTDRTVYPIAKKYNDAKGMNDEGTNEMNCKCIVNERKVCKVGCGCVCDNCYSHCWPKDWIKEDYPGARVISINYTSDPHLWRPLWIKENKRLRLHERAEQMTTQLLALGVGERPVIWVGHSKGGLFIKQIYCEAYEAYLKTKGDKHEQRNEQNMTEFCKDNDMNNLLETDNNYGIENNATYYNGTQEVKNIISVNENPTDLRIEDNTPRSVETGGLNKEDPSTYLKRMAGLWSQSCGFMFYSVPHRGSPLADIKTPITARSVELLEISKDCTLVLSLQERWLRAAAPARPRVRSLVETRRTLMSVLWLRIVSADSADPGIGALSGVSVDHREICKPTSRQCMLYKELTAVIQSAVQSRTS